MSSSESREGGGCGRGGSRSDYRGGRGGARGSDRGGRRGGRGGGRGSGRDSRRGFGGNADIVRPEYNFKPEYEQEITTSNPLPKIAELIASEEALRKPGDPLSLVKRPGYGTVGIKTKVGTNFIKFDVSNMSFYYYIVTFQPEIDAKKKVKKDLLEILISKEPFVGLKKHISHDGSSAIYSLSPIPIKKDAKIKFEFDPEEWKGIVPSSVTSALKGSEKGKQPVDAPYPKIWCTVEYKHKLSMDDLNNWTSITDKKGIEATAYVQALNVVLGYKIAKNKNVFLAGKNKFFFVDKPEKCQSFQKGLYIANGYFTSVTPTFDHVMINVRPVIGAFFKSHNKDGTPMSVADLIADYFSESDLSKIPKDQILRSKNFFKGIRIHRAYLGAKSKPKTIFDISRDDTSNSYKFEVDGNLTSVTSYFDSRYKMKLKYPDHPLVHLGGSNYIPMEACLIIPGQDFKGEIDDIRGVLSFSTHRPHVIAGLVQQDGIKNISQILEKDEATRLGNKLVVVPSRVLTAPVLEYKNSQVKFTERAADGKSEKGKGSWDLVGRKFYKPISGKRNLLVLIIENERRPLREADLLIKQACKEFVTEVQRLGVAFTEPKYEKVSFQNIEYLSKDIVNKIKVYKGKADYILSILPQREKAIYASVKTALDKDLGILNQCTIINKFTKQRFGKFDSQMYALMSMKTCIKLGGANHVLSNADVGKLIDADGLPALLLGADVTHPTNGTGTVSIASVVGSIDANFNSFPGSISIQEPRLETIVEMSKMVVERILAYQKSLGKLPKTILFYRDGVSNGQFNVVLDEEVTAVKNAFKDIASKLNIKFEPKLTFITILKNHATRFFPLEKNARNAEGKDVAVQSQENIMPGSIVEKGVVSRSLYDFYLQSQQALQGTAIPGHYYVLFDENNWKPDELQQATYNLCNVFGRATKSVRVVPPAYYADLLCERATCFVQSSVSDKERNPVEAGRKALGSGIHKDVSAAMIYI